jgi:hypothetical protein
LLTGLGIIGTFSGLISGLRNASGGGGLDTQALISSVGDAFIFSAGAIIAAMLVTFLEKWRYARLLHVTDQLCRAIDRLYSAGVGEEYLRRLVAASEQAVTNSQQLKDSLVGELGNILERLAEKQIEAAGRHSAELRTSLQQPIEAVAKGFSDFGRAQGQTIRAGLQDQMGAFADKLEQLLGGQVGQAKELQAETVRARPSNRRSRFPEYDTERERRRRDRHQRHVGAVGAGDRRHGRTSGTDERRHARSCG